MPAGTLTAMLAAEKKPIDRRRHAGREHVVRPDAEADEAGREQGQHDQPVADQRRLRESVATIIETRPGGGQEDDVDLRVAEEPEEVLPEQRVAAAGGVEEGPVERALELEQQRAEDDRREGR